jgi:aryl-alcohol dehydrogenase-like predicted oxidoreductase
MEYRRLGRTGLKVSSLCMGAMTFGRETSEEESFRMLDRFKAAGGNFIDTANVYSAGTSEEIVGRWLQKEKRGDYVVATKVRFPTGSGPNDVGLSRSHIMREVDESLRRLGTDYIDLYQLHCRDRETPLEETLSALDDLVRQGKVRYIGVSNFGGAHLQKAVDIARSSGLAPVASLQAKYNLLVRSPEWELLPTCRREGIGLMVWSPLNGGWLSGRYTREMTGPPAESRVEQAAKEGWFEAWENYNTEHTWNVIEALFEVAGEMDKTPAQVALAWLLATPGVTSPIVGARTMRHLEDNLKAAEWSLPEELKARLDRESALPLPYPYDFLSQMAGGLE